ncbi:MAG: circadian clock KaiB family protein [Lentisphaerae bacterium]|nr:circadian clock KaiB family protein [Lentisphaerota bacterium]
MKRHPRTRPPRASTTAKPHRRADKYVLRLYVAGATARSQQAILRAREFCESQFKGAYTLDIIDIYQQPILARNGQILATPTLVKEYPRPVRQLIGNLTNTAGLIIGLDLNRRIKTTP